MQDITEPFYFGFVWERKKNATKTNTQLIRYDFSVSETLDVKNAFKNQGNSISPINSDM